MDLFTLVGNGDVPYITINNKLRQQIAGFNLGLVSSKTVPTFFGFESEEGISEVNIGTFTGGPIFDHIIFGGRVPEPSSGLLLLLAFVEVTLWRVRYS